MTKKLSQLDIQQRYMRLGIGDLPAHRIGNQPRGPAQEIGYRSTPENSIKYLYRQMWVDPELRAAVLDIRHMDRVDGRVKKIHARMTRTATKGGLILETPSTNTRLIRLWKDYVRRLRLNKPDKLESDARGLVMEGNLPIQWELDDNRQVVACFRYPSETIVPNVGTNGRFLDLQKAYSQHDLLQGKVIADFPFWKLSVVRLTPDNYDDFGSLGRPYLDASRPAWRKLMMTDENLVIRRGTRSALKMVHILEGVEQSELDDYKNKNEDNQYDITSDYYSNSKGSISAVQGDANLDQIADVNYLLDTFFAGAPAPKGLFGYPGDLNRDILEDLKRDYYDEIDSLQDLQAEAYAEGFYLDLLLRGINPDAWGDYVIKFAERRTETPNQAADRALKYQAMQASMETVHRTAGLDPAKEKQQLEAQAKDKNPYPDMNQLTGPQRVSITPGNARKGESSTTVSN